MRQPEFGDRRADRREVTLELAHKLPRVSNIIHALVEPSGKLRGDRLHAHALACQCPEDEKQVERRLRRLGFICRDFRDEVVFSPGGFDVAVDFPGLAYRQRVGAQKPLQRARIEGLVLPDSREGPPDQRAEGIPNRGNIRRLCRLTDKVGDVDRVKIAVRKKPVHGFESDMVGIQMVGSLPSGGLHRRVGGASGIGRRAADQHVFAV